MDDFPWGCDHRYCGKLTPPRILPAHLTVFRSLLLLLEKPLASNSICFVAHISFHDQTFFRSSTLSRFGHLSSDLHSTHLLILSFNFGATLKHIPQVELDFSSLLLQLQPTDFIFISLLDCHFLTPSFQTFLFLNHVLSILFAEHLLNTTARNDCTHIHNSPSMFVTLFIFEFSHLRPSSTATAALSHFDLIFVHFKALDTCVIWMHIAWISFLCLIFAYVIHLHSY